jgi:hypothetical protein
LPKHARPVLDHVRSGKEWNLAHKDDGLFYLPMEVDEIVKPVTGDIGAYYRNLRFVEVGSKKLPGVEPTAGPCIILITTGCCILTGSITRM